MRETGTEEASPVWYHWSTRSYVTAGWIHVSNRQCSVTCYISISLVLLKLLCTLLKAACSSAPLWPCYLLTAGHVTNVSAVFCRAKYCTVCLCMLPPGPTYQGRILVTVSFFLKMTAECRNNDPTGIRWINSGWMTGWMTEWMNEWMNEWKLYFCVESI